MTPLALTVVVACAVAWSGFDWARKTLVERISPTPLMLLLTAGQAPLFAAWAAFDGAPAVGGGYWPPAVGSVALNVVANLAFIHAFRVAPISLTIPLLSLTPVVTALLAVPLLGELPTWRQGAGILLVVGGTFLLNLRHGEASVAGLARSLVREPGVRLMLVVVLCWSLTPPLDKLAMDHASPAAHGFVLCAGVAVVVAALLLAQGRVGEVRQVARAPAVYLLAIGVSVAGLALQLVAYRLVYVAFVETFKRGLGNAMALVYGRFLFAERVGVAQVTAVALMAIGVTLILV
ncbi:MAG TPA: DMT family transporter [Thermoanaerobaculia bacterium]|nr:DMT family transporter [Thermoanaerobaculia bacterium]